MALKSADLLAGLSIAGLLLPEAVAYSGVANLPPQAGVLALFAGLLCYGLIGRSRFAIVTATSSSAAVLASATAALGAGDVTQRVAFASILVAGAGVAFTLAAALRLGAISNLIARPVLRGYAFGLALVIAVKQWPNLVQMHPHASGFFPLLLELLRGAGTWHVASLACGLAALAGLFVLERAPRLPGALVVIVASILLSGTLAAHGVKLTGMIDLTLAAPHFTRPAQGQWLQMCEFSLALMFILYAESYGSIRTFALKHDQPVQPNRDLLALGVANMVGGLIQAAPVGAGYSGTSANEAAGATSRLAGLTAALVILVMVLLLLPWIERIPEPVLGAIVIHAVSRSLRLSAFQEYFRWRRDRLTSCAAVLSVMVLGVLNGLLAAIALSLALLIRSLATPAVSVLGRAGEHDYVSVSRYPSARLVPGITVLRPEQPLFFGNAEPAMMQARQHVMNNPGSKQVVLSLEESPDLDATAIETLREFGDWLQAHGAALRLARLKDRARDALARADLPCLSGPGALDYASVDDAVQGRTVL
ncbi:MAG: SulP family inorganic anion transporter [Proteobacteria bacterium]|nr:SulP family inorganic anion transporter [Pseudomonadota bacterium]